MARTCSLNRDPIDPLLLAGLLILVFVINLLYRAWRSRIRHSHYEFSSDGDRLKLKSDLGEFVFDPKERSVAIHYVDDRKLKFAFSDIRNIELVNEDKDAVFQEMFLEGFSVFIDTNPKYRDVVQRYSIFVVTNDYKRYPLVVMQQYMVKDLWNVGVEFQLGLLELLSMYTPVEFRAKGIYEELKKFLGSEFRFDRE